MPVHVPKTPLTMPPPTLDPALETILGAQFPTLRHIPAAVCRDFGMALA